ncbi:DUF134 domain-containing protein [Spirochaetota bacterium]
MSRPHKCRRIGFTPDLICFKPAGIPGKILDKITLSIDEYEAIRLADLKDLYQEEAAKKMNISRQTFGNILVSAHNKIADCLINGKMLVIKGGKVNMQKERNFICYECKNEWSIPFGTGRPSNCPSCESNNIHRSEKDRGYMKNVKGRGRCLQKGGKL